MLITKQYMTEAELLAENRRILDRRLRAAPAIREALIAPAPPPRHYTPEQQERRMRSLRRCHLPSRYQRPRHPKPKDSGAYVPASAANLENDRNLTDGARRCARKLMEETHRRDRKERTLQINVSYLAKGLRRCRRTVQRYLGLLEREGYISVQVMAGSQTRMCIGLIVKLLPPLFPRHDRKSWAQKRGNPDATQESQNESRNIFKEEKDPYLAQFPYVNSYHPRFRALHDPRCHAYSREDWAEKCMAGVFRALLRALPPPVLSL